jgi:nicotinamidase-related amidase
MSPGRRTALNAHGDREPRQLRLRADPLEPGARRAGGQPRPGITFFLGTVRPDGTHAAGLGAVWADDALWFVTGPRTRKGRNLAGNPACTISGRLSGIDVVLEGRAERVTDPDALERLTAEYRDAGWPAEVVGETVIAPQGWADTRLRPSDGSSRATGRVGVMPRALLLIDIQRDYFPDGRHPLVGSDRAADAAASVLAGFRDRSEPIVHVQHSWDEPAAAYLKPGTPGYAHDERVAPADGEPVVVKEAPNAFIGTDLEQRLRADGIDQLVVAGMMTSMCVDATVRAAADLGFAVTVVGDACAAPDLEYAGVAVPGEQVHAAFLAALGEGYAEVVDGASVGPPSD